MPAIKNRGYFFDLKKKWEPANPLKLPPSD